MDNLQNRRSPYSPQAKPSEVPSVDVWRTTQEDIPDVGDIS